MSTQQPLQVESVLVSRLFLNPANPRRNDAAVPHVVASIKRFGWRQPIVAKRSGEVIAGNTRLKAAQALHLTEVPVVWFDGSNLDATAYAIADNRTHEFSEWDPPALVKLLEELRAEDSLEGVGYTAADLDALVAELEDNAETGNEVDDPGPEKPPRQPVTRAGDLWNLGRHRLLCGDSTNAADVARVMNGEKASLMATDPPYCVGYSNANRPNDSKKD